MTLWQRWRGGRDGGDGSCPRILWTESWSEDLRLSTQRHWWDFAWPRRHMRPETGLVLLSIIIGSICVVSILQFLLFQNWPWHPHSFEATALDENCIFRDTFFAQSPNTSYSTGTTQKDRVVTTTKAMRSENFIAKSYFLPFEGPAFLSVSIWGMKLCMLVKKNMFPMIEKEWWESMEKSSRTSAKTSSRAPGSWWRFSRSFSMISPWNPTTLSLWWGTYRVLSGYLTRKVVVRTTDEWRPWEGKCKGCTLAFTSAMQGHDHEAWTCRACRGVFWTCLIDLAWSRPPIPNPSLAIVLFFSLVTDFSPWGFYLPEGGGSVGLAFGYLGPVAAGSSAHLSAKLAASQWNRCIQKHRDFYSDGPSHMPSKQEDQTQLLASICAERVPRSRSRGYDHVARTEWRGSPSLIDFQVKSRCLIGSMLT